MFLSNLSILLERSRFSYVVGASLNLKYFLKLQRLEQTIDQVIFFAMQNTTWYACMEQFENRFLAARGRTFICSRLYEFTDS